MTDRKKIFGKLDQQGEAQKYLTDNKIIPLLNHLTASLLYHRPDDEKKFMIDQLASIKTYRANRTTFKQPPLLFTKENVLSLFKLFDTTEKGWISVDQYKEGMKQMGLTEFNQNPMGTGSGKIKMEIFMEEANQALIKAIG